MRTRTRTGIEVRLEPKNGKVFASINHPKTGEQNFPVNWGIHKNNEGAIGTITVRGKLTTIVLTIPKEAWENVKAEAEKQIEDYRKRVREATVSKVSFIMGCDIADSYEIEYKDLDDVPFDYIWERKEEEIELLRRFLSHPSEEVFEGAKRIEPTLTSYGGWEWSGNSLKKLLNNIEKWQEQEAKNKERIRIEERRHIEKLLELARVTGEPQVINRRLIDCQDPNEPDCSFDELITLAMPDGTIKTISNHCY